MNSEAQAAVHRSTRPRLADVGWIDGRVVRGRDFRVSPAIHGLHHATCVLEGIRGYREGRDVVLFRLDDHLRRLLRSAELMGISTDATVESLQQAVHETVAVAGAVSADELYVRPMIFVADPSLGVDIVDMRSSTAIAIWRLDEAHKASRMASGRSVTCTLLPWRRASDGWIPAQAKTAATYAGASRARAHARAAGFDDAIVVNTDDRVVEATTSNLFIVRDGVVATPPLSDGPLAGITRGTVCELAGIGGLPVDEVSITADEVLDADEVFLTGTFIGLAPVARVGPTSFGGRAAVTQRLKNALQELMTDGAQLRNDWFDRVRC